MIEFARKLSGSTEPSNRNEFAIGQAVTDFSRVAATRLKTLETNAPPRTGRQKKKSSRANFFKSDVISLRILDSVVENSL